MRRVRGQDEQKEARQKVELGFGWQMTIELIYSSQPTDTLLDNSFIIEAESNRFDLRSSFYLSDGKEC